MPLSLSIRFNGLCLLARNGVSRDSCTSALVVMSKGGGKAPQHTPSLLIPVESLGPTSQLERIVTTWHDTDRQQHAVVGLSGFDVSIEHDGTVQDAKFSFDASPQTGRPFDPDSPRDWEPIRWAADPSDAIEQEMGGAQRKVAPEVSPGWSGARSAHVASTFEALPGRIIALPPGRLQRDTVFNFYKNTGEQALVDSFEIRSRVRGATKMSLVLKPIASGGRTQRIPLLVDPQVPSRTMLQFCNLPSQIGQTFEEEDFDAYYELFLLQSHDRRPLPRSQSAVDPIYCMVAVGDF